jgi:hypothetical protein
VVRQTKSASELLREAEEAQRQAERTIGYGEDILDKARELTEALERRIRNLTAEVPRPTERDGG